MKASTWQPKQNGQWNRMQYAERVAYIATLTDEQILEQARVRAAASGRAVTDILTAWTLNGLLDYDRKLRLIAELEGR